MSAKPALKAYEVRGKAFRGSRQVNKNQEWFNLVSDSIGSESPPATNRAANQVDPKLCPLIVPDSVPFEA